MPFVQPGLIVLLHSFNSIAVHPMTPKAPKRARATVDINLVETGNRKAGHKIVRRVGVGAAYYDKSQT